MADYYGSIVKKELEYDESRGLVPVAAVSQGERGLLHVTARNDMTTPQNIGIFWLITDPDGMVVEEYTDWKGWPIPTKLGAGETHEFIGGRFTFSKLGKYIVWIKVLMGSPDNPVEITWAGYAGELCTVIPSEAVITSFSISDYATV